MIAEEEEGEGERGPRDSGRWWLETSEVSKDTSGLWRELGENREISPGGRGRSDKREKKDG